MRCSRNPYEPAEAVAELIAGGLKVLIYSVGTDSRARRHALAAGAQGMSLKSESIPTTLAKIRAVAAGAQIISPEILAMIDGDSGFVEAKLSAREREVLVMHVSGLEVPQTARQLFVTPDTARGYQRRIRANTANWTVRRLPRSTCSTVLSRMGSFP